MPKLLKTESYRELQKSPETEEIKVRWAVCSDTISNKSNTFAVFGKDHFLVKTEAQP